MRRAVYMFLTALLVGCTNEIQELETLVDVSIAQTHDWSVVISNTSHELGLNRSFEWILL